MCYYYFSHQIADYVILYSESRAYRNWNAWRVRVRVCVCLCFMLVLDMFITYSLNISFLWVCKNVVRNSNNTTNIECRGYSHFAHTRVHTSIVHPPAECRRKIFQDTDRAYEQHAVICYSNYKTDNGAHYTQCGPPTSSMGFEWKQDANGYYMAVIKMKCSYVRTSTILHGFVLCKKMVFGSCWLRDGYYPPRGKSIHTSLRK